MMTEPVRMCLACRRRAAKADLVRVVVRRDTAAAGGDGGAVAVDPQARQPGRGAYVCRREDCLARALRRGGAGLHRALRAPRGRITVDADALTAQWRAAVHGATGQNGRDDSAHVARETA